MELEIVYLSPEELTPYENNTRKHGKIDIEGIKQSITADGFNDPIGIWGEKNLIVEGHGRQLAALELGIEKVPCIRLDHLTDEQRRDYAIRHNRTAEQSTWEWDLLEKEVKELEALGHDFSNMNFEFPETEEENVEIIEDEPPELPEEPNAKHGDIYELGRHRLMCGDSTKSEDVNQLMNGATADLLFTDPPYNVNVSNSSGMTIENDNLKNEDFINLLNSAFKNAHDNLKKGGAFYIWHSSTEADNFMICAERNKLQVRQVLIWVKNGFILGHSDYKWKHEPCLYGWKEGAAHYFIDEFTHSTVIDDKIDIEKLKKDELKKLLYSFLSDNEKSTVIYDKKPLVNDLHPTMKPLSLCSYLIRNSSKQNETVLDLFGGSGSTMMACEQINRTCYTMEYDPKYVDVIIERWEQFTGKKAKKIKSANEE